MTTPPLPHSHKADEVQSFHPCFEFAANEALSALSLTEVFEVVHHLPLGELIPDFVFIERATGRLCLIVEIKRTPAAVRSTQYRSQARNYVHEAGARMAVKYYAVSNLEVTDLFRYREGFSVAGQLLADSPFDCGNFSDPDDAFYTQLVGVISQLLRIVCGELETGEHPQYATGLHSLETSLASVSGDITHWHQRFMPIAYECVFGASTSNDHLRRHVEAAGWQPALSVSRNPRRLAELGRRVDFSAVFAEPITEASDPSAFDREVLEQAFRSGQLRGTGDEVASLAASLVSDPANGVVETDTELATLVQALAATYTQTVADGAVICDPAAGGGQLLAGLGSWFADVKPSQIWANDVESRFAEIAALRLGLDHAHSLDPNDAPTVTSANIADLTKEDFESVRVVLLNPPFVSGVNSVTRKAELTEAITRVCADRAVLDVGQAALEMLFIELVTKLVQPGTVVVTVFPHRHLLGTGPEAVELRRFLLSDFGLTGMFSYPSIGIFESVVKKTCVLVGIASAEPDEVVSADIAMPLADVDMRRVQESVRECRSDLPSGVSVEVTSRQELYESAPGGWRRLIGPRRRAMSWIEALDLPVVELGRMPNVQLRRGRAGNNGGSNLIFPEPDSSWLTHAPAEWRRVGIRTASENELPPLVGSTTTTKIALSPPQDAYEPDNPQHAVLTRVIEEYLASTFPHDRAGQPRHELSLESARAALTTSKPAAPGAVLIPRAVRRTGRIGLLDEPAVPSTNFAVVEVDETEVGAAVAAWLVSVFGQIQLEVFSVDQEGMRKSEMRDFAGISVPDFAELAFSPADYERCRLAFECSPAFDFYDDIEPREVDRIWIDLVPQLETDDLQTAFELLKDLVAARHSG